MRDTGCLEDPNSRPKNTRGNTPVRHALDHTQTDTGLELRAVRQHSDYEWLVAAMLLDTYLR